MNVNGQPLRTCRARYGEGLPQMLQLFPERTFPSAHWTFLSRFGIYSPSQAGGCVAKGREYAFPHRRNWLYTTLLVSST